jgi:protein-L-isoaspartate(D-aspartate) O-methyltransferase
MFARRWATGRDAAMMDWTRARANMVESQVRTRDVTDRRLLEALARVPRELFVPASVRHLAYSDGDLPLGGGRALMEPMHFARMVQLAEVGPGEVVLDVGCATGYSTAVLAELASSVVAIEEAADLAEAAGQTLSEIGADNAVVMTCALAEGLAAEGPYDVIVLEGAVETLPESLFDQLADGGRLVCVRQDQGIGRIWRFVKRGGQVGRRSHFDAQVPALPGFAKEPVFVF